MTRLGLWFERRRRLRAARRQWRRDMRWAKRQDREIRRRKVRSMAEGHERYGPGSDIR